MQDSWQQAVARAWVGAAHDPETRLSRLVRLGKLFPGGQETVTPEAACRAVAAEHRRALRGGPDDFVRGAVAARIRAGLDLRVLQEAAGPRGGLCWRLDRAAFNRAYAEAEREVARSGRRRT